MLDTTDDLHSAEDLAGALGAELARIAEAIDGLAECCDEGELRDELERLAASATTATRAWSSYCRPGCGAHGQVGECEGEDPLMCGCPCGHSDHEPDPYAGSPAVA